MDSLPHSSDGNHYPSIPTHSRAPTSLRCCCGRDDCALLEHNNLALEGLEKDLETAAKLGQVSLLSSLFALASVMTTLHFHDPLVPADCQASSSLTFALQALLYRHESYIAEAEEDRQRLLENVDSLELEKRQIKAENARVIEENRCLLEQLDGLNQAAVESDDQIKSLSLTLERTEAEVRRLTVAASRAEELEMQLAIIETEQLKLQDSLTTAQEDERSAVQRWRNAEHTLRALNDQVERIETEAREERERHEEIIQRMERKRNVERELENAAVRLKGAAAASELGRNPGTPVVSRFVKDILEDNAHLQVGIIELREMLESSNQEVQNLRDQVLYHQPLDGVDEEDGESTPVATLSDELDAKERRVSQEFHVHHHYHTPTTTRKDKGSLNRRVKKKRPSLGSPGPMHSAMTNSPRRSIHRSQSSGSSLNTILSQTSVSIPPSTRRWSLQSPAADSLASSPRSAFRTSSIFDRTDRGYDFSQATSPDSTVFSSPLIDAHNTKGFDLTNRPMDGFDHFDQTPMDPHLFSENHYDQPGFLDLCEGVKSHPAIPEESEPSPPARYSESKNDPHTAEDITGLHISYTPSLRRSASHDSLLSVAGMDIHTSINRQARMGDWHTGLRIPQRLMSPSVELVSTPPIISAPTVMVDRVKGQLSSRSLLASMAASAGNLPSDSASAVSADSSSTTSTTTPTSRKSSALGRWVMGRWGVSAVPERDPQSEDRIAAIESALVPEPPKPESESTPSVPPKATAPEPAPTFRFRHPGVNQKGPILGLRPPLPAPVTLHAQDIDENLLRESLAENGESA
ncbi:hypothetical protein N7520_001872 [Penicillium odoratum]|uniref:uncharacterized protein n=1 Tax=Penicillium odoratum TaxID=1167516 RepID=UPI00254869F4|nr:uncharacterized protein N7520_001872 [Penicillium odoratum]KAJ5778626.1 hypothetical protein N7520_001872 [Penicillium odoratum]